MDDRFPKFIRWLSRKLDFFAIPNLGTLIAALAVLAFVAQYAMGVSLDRFILDPALVMQGEYWRLFAFPVEASHPIWFLFYVLLIYYVINSLEGEWGASLTTFYVFFGYFAAVGAAFLLDRPVSVWTHVLANTTLAFATLFPNVEFLLFFILPVKVKWIAAIMGVFLGWEFLAGSLSTKLLLLIVMSPYYSFFGKIFWLNVREKRRKQAYKKLDKDMWR